MGLAALHGAARVRGWHRIAFDAGTARWARAAHAAGLRAVDDPDLRAKWLQCEGTWFVGVDALPTDGTGAIDGVPLEGPARELVSAYPDLHPAQLSVLYPGYPKPRAGESAAAFRYRVKRCAAHVDGILAEGSEKRRYVREPHAFILGLPLTETDMGASPLTVWEGSHRIMQRSLSRAIGENSPMAPSNEDVTDTYTAARRKCFEICTPRRLHARPGEALLLHPLMLHGIAPWHPGAVAPREGRMMAYFRPICRGGISEWLNM